MRKAAGSPSRQPIAQRHDGGDGRLLGLCGRSTQLRPTSAVLRGADTRSTAQRDDAFGPIVQLAVRHTAKSNRVTRADPIALPYRAWTKMEAEDDAATIVHTDIRRDQTA